jgi:tetratricopeptide (TPR) repeat protein
MIASAHDGLTLCCDVHPTELVEARRAAQRALELDEDLAEAHSALAASLYLYYWDFAQAEKHYKRALELNPNSATSHSQYGDFLLRMGRHEEAAAERKRAIEIEPLSPFFNAFALFDADPGSAVERARFVIDLDPSFYFSHVMAAGVYARMKMYPEAIATYQRAKELAPENTWTDVNLSRVFVQTGQLDQVRAILEELLRRSESRYVPPFHIALVYHQLGDVERSLDWLEKAYQVHDPKMTFIKTIPLRKLQADPRYQDIYRRVFGS